MAKTTVDIQALFRALEDRRFAERKNWKVVASEIGVYPSLFSHLSQGRRPNADAFVSLLRWLDAPAERFMLPGKAAPVSAPVSFDGSWQFRCGCPRCVVIV